MIVARRLAHARFETPDLERSIAYYTETNGLVLVARNKDEAFLATRLGRLAVVLKSGKTAHCTGLAFEVAPDTDFEASIRALAKRGIGSEQRNDPAPGIAKALVFADPKGTAIELTSRCDFVPVGEAAGVAPFKLGHVAFFVEDPQAIAVFYQTVLGFRVSDWIEDFFVFLRCNSDHHAVNFIRGRRPRLHHIAFELQNFAHLRAASDALGQRKIPIIWGPVRLGPGHNVAIFHRNADDQVVEFYAELDQINDEALGYFEPRPWHRDHPQRPKVWSRADGAIWGPPPTADFFRDRE